MKSIIEVVAGVIFFVGLLASARVMGQAVNITGEWAFTVTTATALVVTPTILLATTE